ncbi:hypothetical protein L6452_42425 [Arctium lappa]|uniref:Uncharacterized protein n=1 Tax=Arctium lappa TaxID=4217 RepID=A0ACB8XI80_ARCLA|nr:hypothetical protein L6452_42425 [Arctium lappa]
MLRACVLLFALSDFRKKKKGLRLSEEGQEQMVSDRGLLRENVQERGTGDGGVADFADAEIDLQEDLGADDNDNELFLDDPEDVISPSSSVDIDQEVVDLISLLRRQPEA